MSPGADTQRRELMLKCMMFGVVLGSGVSLAMLSHGSEGVLSTFIQMLVATAATYLIVAKFGHRVIANEQ